MREMSMTPRETVEEIYRRYAGGDIPGVLALSTDDVEYIAFGDPEMDVFAGHFKGKEALAARFAETARLFEFRRFEPVEYIAEGDRVAVRCACAATRRETGEEIETELAHFFTIENGKLARILEYFDTARVGRALAAR
jgi:ketosteroid isomerase-like protein